MNKFLIFVEDPGAANMIFDFPNLFKNLNSDFQIIANNYAADILHKMNINFVKIENSREIKEFLKGKSFDFFIVGTSENRNSLGLEIINIAKAKNILSIGLIDMSANYQYRFSGNSQNPLKFKPDKLIVTDENTKINFINLGFEKENIFICNHPQEERIKNIKYQFINKGKKILKKNKRWLFVSEDIDLLNPKESFLNKEYSLYGNSGSKWRTGIVLEEIIESIRKLNPKPDLVVRLHPKNKKSQFLDWSNDITFDDYIDPLESVWNSDVILGMTSNLLVEAMYLGKPVFSILTRVKEREWMHELRTGRILSVYNRKDLRNLINNVFIENYPKVNSNANSIEKNNLINIFKDLKNLL
tara:strand:+ start:5695 stop:6765 length:1071 start_codon:yes stop_codon:yes gene_type:complete